MEARSCWSSHPSWKDFGETEGTMIFQTSHSKSKHLLNVHKNKATSPAYMKDIRCKERLNIESEKNRLITSQSSNAPTVHKEKFCGAP